MIRKLREARENEEGFTLIELLVVVIIIGILAAIAIPVFLNQRENAYRSAAESDARNAAIAMESAFTQLDAYPTGTAVAMDSATSNLWYVATGGGISSTSAATDVAEITISNGVTLTYTNNTGSYDIVATHDQLGTESVTYDSTTGGLGDWTP